MTASSLELNSDVIHLLAVLTLFCDCNLVYIATLGGLILIQLLQ